MVDFRGEFQIKIKRGKMIFPQKALRTSFSSSALKFMKTGVAAISPERHCWDLPDKRILKFWKSKDDYNQYRKEFLQSLSLGHVDYKVDESFIKGVGRPHPISIDNNEVQIPDILKDFLGVSSAEDIIFIGLGDTFEIMPRSVSQEINNKMSEWQVREGIDDPLILLDSPPMAHAS